MQASLKLAFIFLLIVAMVIPIFTEIPENKLVNLEKESSIITSADGDFIQVGNWTPGGSTNFDSAYGIDVRSGIAYVAGQNSGLTILNVSDPTNIYHLGDIDFGCSANDVAVHNDLLYVCCAQQKLIVLNISDSTNPIQLSEIYVPGNLARISISNSMAAIAAEDQWSLVDITNSLMMNVTMTMTGFYSMYEILISDNLVFMSAQDTGFYIYNVTNAYAPNLLSHTTFDGQCSGFAIAGYYAYVAQGNGLDVINISNPSNVNNVGHFEIGYGLYYTVSGYTLYMGMLQGVGVVDIHSPSNPYLIDTYGLSGGRTDVVVDGVCYVIDNILGVFCFDFDIDNDGLADCEETKYGTNYLNNDSDNDLLLDGEEIKVYGTDPLDPDSDDDLLLDGPEVNTYMTNPLDSDSDGDTLSDYDEVMVHLSNPNSCDSDQDNITDPIEVNTYGTNPSNNDTDNDLLTDYNEIFVYFTDPVDWDTDDDFMSDGLEVLSGLDPFVADGTLDPDNDRLVNLEEINYQTNPWYWDSDNDTLGDYDEIYVYKSNPILSDSDMDLLTDGDEVNTYMTDPNYYDTDFDNLCDYDEIFVYYTDPLDSDSDNDTLSDYDEVAVYGTNPNSIDSDNDTLNDKNELYVYLTDPLNADSDSDNVDDGLEVLFGLDPTLSEEGGLVVMIARKHGLTITLIVCGIVSLPTVRYASRQRKKQRLEHNLSVINKHLTSLRIAGTTEDVNYTTREEIDRVYIETKSRVGEVHESTEDMSLVEGITDITELSPLIEQEYQEAVKRIESSAGPAQMIRSKSATVCTDIESGIEVLRGCEVIGGTFEYKVKVQNGSSSVITNIRVSIVAYPEESMLIAGESTREVSRIEIGGFRSLLFRFAPTKDCVEGNIVANVTFLDPRDEAHTLDVNPYTIRSVCDLLKPIEIESTDFELILDGMQSSHEEHIVDWNPEVLYVKTKQMLQSKNFHVVSSDEHSSNGNYIGTIRGIAQGKYTEKQIATIIIISGSKDGTSSNVRIEALGDDIAMLPTTIHELTEGVKAWTCIRCGAPLPPETVDFLRADISTSCHYCATALTIDDYTKSGGE